MNAQGVSSLISAPLQAQASTTSGSSGTGGSSSNSTTSPSGLQTMFLNLLVTELQNQDPTQPVDPTQMVGQMISLNQLDQLVSINQTLSSLATPTTSATSSQTPTAAAKTATPLAAQAVASALPLAFQPNYNGAPASGLPMSLYNLYSNIGAPANAVNHFTTLGGK